jgi:hypothetical protein
MRALAGVSTPANWFAGCFAGLTAGPGHSESAAAMETKLALVQIEKPETINFIFGQTHFIKSVKGVL